MTKKEIIMFTLKSIMKKILFFIIALICIIIFFVSLYKIVKIRLEDKENAKDIQNIIDDSISPISHDDNNQNQNFEKIIDWEYLEDVNKDIIGWIEIENTNINYPILKDTGNLYYLKHLYNGKYNNNGSIFTINQEPFNESETIIYGHNMKNGNMFSILGNYLKEGFLEEHPTIKIYTSKRNYTYKIFSVYSISVEKEKQNIENLSFNEKINYYKSTSKYEIYTDGNINNLIKLCTCSYLSPHTTPTNQRYYIVGYSEN